MSASKVESYIKGTRVWIRDVDCVWKAAVIAESYKLHEAAIKIENDDGDLIEYVLESAKTKEVEFPELRNPDILSFKDDLTSLSYLNEPEVLYNLKERFINHQIYTKCGIVLVAINPYAQLRIYDDLTINEYNEQDADKMNPHIFAVSKDAFKNMKDYGHNQSIIVSGESGAGKTVSAKYAMRYFAHVGGSSEETQIEKKVLASNPIMEAFGNAKTTRNDNSSRFGKYIELNFDRKPKIIGANMRTYLLEKSRVVFQAQNERNYHIFYQLCSQRSSKKYERLALRSPDEFLITSKGRAPKIDNVDDSVVFKETTEAFHLLDIDEKQQGMIFNVIASIMHLGNVELISIDSEKCKVKDNDESLRTVCRLLEINEQKLKESLCSNRLKAVGEVVSTNFNLSKAYFGRDALAKHMYSQLFNWIVEKINDKLKSNARDHKSIGVLDIYGFETFAINSFEQFCINYANEKLQQQFCQHVFKLEQEEYKKEGIQWSDIEFSDNQRCIELIEGSKGILALLDEELKVPQGSDLQWCGKLYRDFEKSEHFNKFFARPKLTQSSFIIQHFAERVEYQSNGFLEKNRDTIYEDQLKVLKNSENDLIAMLFIEDGDKQKPQGYEVNTGTMQASHRTQANRKKSVAAQFRESLNNLMETLNKTTPHYVRCIKPNDQKAPFQFEPKRAVEQLQACGVLATVKISAAGYPSRWTYEEFYKRFRMLVHSKLVNRKEIGERPDKIRDASIKILKNLIKNETVYQLGKTKVFFRAGQVAELENARTKKHKESGIIIQKHIRGWLARLKFKKMKKSIGLMQKYGRAVLARRLYKFKRETRAAARIQTFWREYVKWRNRKNYLIRLAKIKAVCMRYIGRKNKERREKSASATIIQAHVRGWLQRIRYRKIIRGIVLVQAHFRRRKARKEYKLLKIESRSVEHQRKLNKGLENKIISLQQNIEKINKEKETLSSKLNEIEPLKQQVTAFRQSANANKDNQLKIDELTGQLNELRSEVGRIKKEKENAVKEREELKHSLTQISKESGGEIAELRKKLDEANQRLQAAQFKVDELNSQLADIQSERGNHQKLLKEHSKLESRFDKLRTEILKYRNLHPASSETSTNGMDTGTALESLLEELEIDRSNETDESTDANKKAAVPQVKVTTANGDTTLMHNDYEHDYDIIKSQELELENHRLRDDLNRLRKLYDDNEGDSVISSEIKTQFNALNEELQRRRDECIQLKTILVSQSRTLQNHTTNGDTGGIDELVTEGNEFEMAYSSQKILNRMLENQLQESQKSFEIERQRLSRENKTLKEENERQHSIMIQNLPPESLAEETYKYEIGKLSDENLELREKCEELCEEAKKYKKVLKVYIKKSKMANNQSNFNSSFYDVPNQEHTMSSASAVTVTNSNFESNGNNNFLMPQIKYKNGEYMGVLEWKLDDQERLINKLVFELKPRLAITFLPGTPAYILFMCIRYADMLNDDERVRSLLDSTVQAIKKLIKKRQEDLEYVVLWLANLCRLLHNLKQYSGEPAFQTNNTLKQNDHCLKNFDLTEYRGILSDIAIWLFQGIIKDYEKKLMPLIIPAMLEHESLPGMNDAKPSGLRSNAHNSEQNSEKVTIETLIKKMTEFLKTLNSHGVDPEIINQIFKQLFFYIGANTFNNLVLRKGMCHWSKGLEIRFSLSHLEQWIRDSKLTESGALQTLEPVIQASQLLQARKSEGDIKSICEMCSKLTIAQIQRILMLYTPVDEYEEKLSRSFIDNVVLQLKEMRKYELESAQQVVVVDTQATFPICIPFNPSGVSLETIEIPEQLNLSFLKKL